MTENDAADIYKNYIEKARLAEREYNETFKNGYQSNFECPKFCPGDCGHLSITEVEQNKNPNKPDHICLKYNVRVKHGPFHPKLMRCEECLKND